MSAAIVSHIHSAELPSQNKRRLDHIDLGTSLLQRPTKAQRVYYGINIHQLLEDAQLDETPSEPVTSIPCPPAETASRTGSMLWTEKYRPRKFTELIGDERTHRAVMHWLKRWDQIVFPGSYRPKSRPKGLNESAEEKAHRKVLMLAGSAGLGKTTLAHVCAKQAGYETQEINASDERSSNVVKGRIRDMLGTENVKGVEKKSKEGKVRKAGKPVCVVVDEVDGVVSGSGGSGEGGFFKALVDLLTLDQRNSTSLGTLQQAPVRKKNGDRFRMQRPLILICNDVYHPTLRSLRQSSFAEVIHVRKPAISNLIPRLQAIFDKECLPCEGDGVRRLCEATWGVSNRKEDGAGNGAGEGDMRGIMVVGEWVAGKLRAEIDSCGSASLTRRWVESNLLQDLSHGGGAARGLGRGGSKDIVERVFQEGAGFPRSSLSEPNYQTGNSSAKGVAESLKRNAAQRLSELVTTSGDTDRIMMDCFSTYPDHPFQDDTLLSKPDAAYEWLHFHDSLSSAVFSSNEWELAPYLNTPVLAFHHLFASPTRGQSNAATNDQPNNDDSSQPTHPFSGPQASWAAHEASKHNETLIQTVQASLSLDLSRSFRSHADIATELLPYLLRMLSPNVNPVIVGGSGSDKGTASVRKASEQSLVARAVRAMVASGVKFDRTRVNADESSFGGGPSAAYGSQWIYRMEPSLDELGSFTTGGKGFGEAGGKTRYAVRQVLEQEWTKEEKRRGEAARLARFSGDAGADGDARLDAVGHAVRGVDAVEGLQQGKTVLVKRDFFGRPIDVPVEGHGAQSAKSKRDAKQGEGRVWVTYHEGYSNAVRKPLTLAELIKDL